MERRSQTALGWLAVVGGGLAWVALALALDALTEENLAWLVMPPMVALAWGKYALRLGERWALVVELPDGNQRTFFSDQRGTLDQHAELIRPRCVELEAARSGSAQRLVFLDAARALAIVAMVFAHFTDQLLDPALQRTAFGAVYLTT
ncbi:MAG: hypothetical protein H6Q89_5325, partial [Myxococcaceae bacterium]|nr:hypothetical protein [Myxococcaceae bacterium]